MEPVNSGEGLCARGSGQSEGHNDGRLFRNAEGTLRDAEDQGKDEDDGNPVHLLRDPHGECGVAGRSNGEASAGQGGLTG